jgi:Na+-transporting NADH:ubiquinone oxidoreductase subunit C
MNTNSNRYTVIYTTLVCVLVAAVLAVVSQTLKPRQAANEKAETVRQVLVAAGLGEMNKWREVDNTSVLDFFNENIQGSPQIYTTSQLKAQNYNIKNGKPLSLPVYRFKNGVTVLAIYGAGLWGPVWGYIGLEEDMETVTGAYFDHESETPGLGGKIKDDPSFRDSFRGKRINDGRLEFDAISGATMTSRGLAAAIDTWIGAYQNTEQ